jgi:lambda family phage tail tape measure protein
MNALKGAVVLAVQPLLQFFGQFKDGEYDVRAMAGTIQSLAAAYVALRVAAFGAAIAQSAVGKGLKGGAAGLVTGVAAAALTYKGLQELMDKAGAGPQPGTQGPAAGLGPNATMAEAQAEERRIRERRNRDTERRNREQQIGKELQGQLNAVNQLIEGYRGAAQANMDRYTTEVNLLGLTEYEQELIKGTGEIERKYAEQIAALEDKKKGAKGETLKLIQKSIEEVRGLQTSEQDIFEITRQQIFNYKQQQEEVKRVTDEIDKQIGRQETLDGIIRNINDQTGQFNFEKSLIGLTAFEKQIANIQEASRKARLEAGRAFAAGFESEDGLTPERAQQLANGLDKIAQAYSRLENQQLRLAESTDKQQRSFSYGWLEAYKEYAERSKNTAQQARDYFATFTTGVEDAMVKFVQTGKLSFKDLANSMIADLIRIQTSRAITASGGLLGGLLPGLFGNQFTPGSSSFVGPMQPSGGGGFFGNLFGNLFGGLFGGRSAGGAVNMGTPYMVGERGPELFVPGNAGNIVPNNAFGGGSVMQNLTTVNYNIQAVDASSFRSLVARDPQFIYSVTERGRRSQPTRSR